MADVRIPAITLLVMLCIGVSSPYFPERFSDVRAFYCAGQAVLTHADPYREHPLLECESRVAAAPLLSPLRARIAVPAPFPGYVLALFALLALVPFPYALALWTFAAGAAVVVAIVLVARLTGTPFVAVAIVLGFPAATVALPLGQITPFILLAVAAAATLIAKQRPRLAALASLGALLDPHVGLASIIGLAVGVPQARLTLLAGSAGLITLSLAVSGLSRELEYLRFVLPAHALANAADSSQFSTTNFAYMAGAATPIALALGSIWYVAAIAVGTAVAHRLRDRLGTAAFVLIPTAFGVFGGTHTHLAQLAMAVPAFLLLCATVPGARRAAAVILTFVAAIPWLLIAPFPALFPATALLAAVFAQTMNVRQQAVRLAAGTLITLMAIFVAIARFHTNHIRATEYVVGNPLAQVLWGAHVLARNAPLEQWYVFAKAPTVVAFMLIFTILVTGALARRPADARVPGT